MLNKSVAGLRATVAALALLQFLFVFLSTTTTSVAYNPTNAPFGVDRSTGMLCLNTPTSPPGCQTRIQTTGIRYAQITDTLCASDQGPLLQTEMNAAGAGGLLILPGGCILVNTGVTTPQSLHTVGVGPQGTAANQGTQISTTTKTSGAVITLTGPGASISDVWFSDTPPSVVVTISNANPAVVTWAGHGFTAGQVVQFTTTGALPAPLAQATNYFVLSAGLTAGSFRVATTPGGTAIATTDAGSGVQSGNFTNAIAIQLGTGDNSQPTFQRVYNTRVEGFAKGVRVSDGLFYTIDTYYADGARVAGLHINNVNNGDFGDPAISNSYFSSCDTGILFSSGGGPKFSNIKIIGGRVGMDIAPDDAVTTSDISVTSSSIEGTTEHGVRVKRSGTTGVIYSVTLGQIQIAYDGGNGITIGPGANVVIIPSNTLLSDTGAGTAGHAVDISGGNEAGGANVSVVSPTVANTRLSAFHITGGKNYHLDTRFIGAVTNGILVEDTRGNTNVGNETSTYQYTVGLTALTTTLQTLFTIKPGAFVGGYFDFSLEGISNLIGAVSYSSRHTYSNQGAGSSLDLTNSMINATTIVDFSFDTTAVDGTILVQARLHAGGTAITGGSATISVRGRMNTLSYNTVF